MARKKDARKAKRNLVIRQTLIYGLLVAALVVVGVASWGMFTGRIDSWWGGGFSAKPSPSVAAGPQPCPLEDTSTFPEPATVTVNVLNASDRSGVAKATADTLVELGFVASAANAKTGPYDGAIKVVAGPTGVDNAYAVLKVLPAKSVLELDTREDATVDVILGAEADAIDPPDQIDYVAGDPIEPVKGCVATQKILESLLPKSPEPSDGAKGEEPTTEAKA